MISPIFTISFLMCLPSIMAARNSIVTVGTATVNLCTAANFAILAESRVTTVTPSVITGAMVISPIAATVMTGFSLILDLSGQFSTSSQVSGKLYGASYSAPLPATLTMAVADMGTAYSDAMGRANPNFLNLAGGQIHSGLILQPGLYNWGSMVNINSGITIAGGAIDNSPMIGTLNITTGIKMTLTGGAFAKNIVWVALGAITAGTGSHFEGVILKKTGITLQMGATANSRLLTQTLVALQQATVANEILRI
ncbi:antifreeze protein [Mycena epipterygia]|nr:antifreeze protein [Mycena epipterygia]